MIVNKVINKLISNGILGSRLVNLSSRNYIKYDAEIGSFYQDQNKNRIYIQHPTHAIQDFDGTSMINWLCEEIYFKNYLPKNNDTYIDIGAGYGHEIAWLAEKSSCKIFAIEASPIIYAFLCQNIKNKKNASAFNLFIGAEENAYLPFSSSYAGLSSRINESTIKIPAQTFENFNKVNCIEKIDLLKINIEGGELPLLKSIGDMSNIYRVVVSCHDFRANRGDGEFFRTYDEVNMLLESNNFKTRGVNPRKYPNKSWEKSVPYWIFAERINH